MSNQGSKYLRTIRDRRTGRSISIDIYDILEAYKVESQPIGHAIKKLLCPGLRGKGDRLQDLTGAIEAIQAAILQEEKPAKHVHVWSHCKIQYCTLCGVESGVESCQQSSEL